MNVAIIAAAGRGTRAGGQRPKQFQELSGTPIIVHTLRRFEQSRSIAEAVVAVPACDVAGLWVLVERNRLRKVARVVAGGETRAATVWRGLQAVSAESAQVVAVHDGVRPFVTPDEIDRAVAEAEAFGAAVLATRAVDTIKEVGDDGAVARTLERSRLWHAQTPQCFRYELLRRAYDEAGGERAAATDCAALVERLGERVRIVEGDARNIKITTPRDLAIAEVLLREMEE